jgi:hypothetical protein
VPDIPRTKNGKVVELAVKSVVRSMDTYTTRLTSQNALDLFKDIPALGA